MLPGPHAFRRFSILISTNISFIVAGLRYKVLWIRCDVEDIACMHNPNLVIFLKFLTSFSEVCIHNVSYVMGIGDIFILMIHLINP